MSEKYDVIIVGGGASGCAAAEYTSKHHLKTLVLDKGIQEGYLGGMERACRLAGFQEGIKGSEVINEFRRRLEVANGVIKPADVSGIEPDAESHRVKAGDETFEGCAVVLATGAAGRTGYVGGEREFLGSGVFHETHLEWPSAVGQTIAIIGKTKLAAEEALFLTRYAEKIHFVIPSNRLDVDGRLFSQVQHESKIELHFSTSLKTINGDDKVSSITVFTGGQEKEIPVATVFTYMHDHQPTNQFLKNAVQIAQNGGVMVNEQFQTSVPGIFACGDVLCAKPQIPAISIAQGILAGMSVEHYVTSKK